jgi:tetratricopeptide (TPR) repeat protein
MTKALPLLTGLALALCAVPPHAFADTGVSALIKQAQYWRGKGREDLAQQALRRAHALAPDSAEVSAAMTPAAPRPAPPPPAPRAAPVAAYTPAPNRPAPQPAPAADRGGQARASGFAALDDGDLGDAGARFERAISVNRRDADALGGLGLVRLRQQRFAEAADLLGQASRLGRAEQWAQGLAAARFFAGIAEGHAALDAGRIDDAQALAERLVRSGYGQPEPALELLAAVYEREGRFADSAELYRQAAEGGGADENRLKLRAIRGRALAAMAAGDDYGAEQAFQSGLLADRNDPWIRYEFARFMLKRNRLPEAESLTQSLAGLGSADALYAAAMLNADLGRPTQAAELIERIPVGQRTAPINSFAIGVKTDAAIARARQLAAMGRQGEAVSALRQLAGVKAMPAARKAAIASALLDMGDTAGAASAGEAALDAPVTGIDDYDPLVRVLARAGRDDLAGAALQKAGALAGGSPDGQRSYAKMSAALAVGQADRARQAGRFAEAFDMLQGAWSNAPDDADVLGALARLYQSGAMNARAAQTYQLLLAKKPGDRDALLGLAETAQAAGDKDLARKAESDALNAFPQDYQVYMTLSRMAAARGDNGTAVRLLKQARALYAGAQGGGLGDGGNPFAAMDPAGGGNPFRNQAMQAPAPVNPFALGGGTRLPNAQPGYAQPAYAQPAYAAPAYPQRGYQAPTYPGPNTAPPTAAAAPQSSYGAAQDSGYPQLGYAAPTTRRPRRSAEADLAAPAAPGQLAWPSAPNSTGGAAPATASAYGGDPVMGQIQSEIAALSDQSRPEVEVGTSFRHRAGETGLSALDEIQGTAKISAPLAGGRVYASATETVIDAGQPSGSGLARFGRNATIEAQSIVAAVKSPLVGADPQHASGTAFAVGYTNKLVQAEVGTTPVGMGKTQVTFHAGITPDLGGGVQAKAFVERKPVTDSYTAYAGARDPVTGEKWGQVQRLAAGGGLSYDADGSGVYGEGRYYRFTGTNVAENSGFEANIGGYLRAMKTRHSTLTVGLNVNYQGYKNSQNAFTYGNGGYFSPHSFIGIGIPINYAYKDDRLAVNASLTPGFQSYSQRQSALYPTDPAAQADLDALKALDSDVRANYDALSKTGFAMAADVSAWYRVGPNTQVGGEVSYNSFGSYSELRPSLGIKQDFGGGK